MTFRNTEINLGLRRISTVEHCDTGIDKGARLQAAKGVKEGFVNPAVNGQKWSELPPETAMCPIELRGFIGKRRGRVTVVGYVRSVQKNRRFRPVVHEFSSRCDCGAYQIITHVSLSKPNNHDHCCARCSYHAHVAWATERGKFEGRVQ